MSKQKQPAKYFNILTTEGSDEATMFLYGYIGPEWEFDYNTYEYRQVGITDIDFVTELNRLAEQYAVINIRINSPGGEVFHGSAIVTAITNCKAEVRTWNDGVAASMAAGIFLAGKKRYMARNAMLMLHSTINVVWGNAKEMREMADTLDKFSDSLVAGIAAGTGKSEDDIRAAYFSDYKDHWLTYADTMAAGMIEPETEEPDYVAENMPTNLGSMTYRQLVAHFSDKKDTQGSTIMERLRDAFQNTIDALSGAPKSKHTSPPVNTPDMNLEEFKTALADGTLDMSAVQAHLATLNAPTAPAEPAAVETAVDPVAAMQATIDDLTTKMANLQATIEAFGAKPGAQKSAPGMPETDTPDPGGAVNNAALALKETNETIAAAAAAGVNPFRKGRN